MTSIRIPLPISRSLAVTITVLAGMWTCVAHAGVDAWTTTGPRAAWFYVNADTSPSGAIALSGARRHFMSIDGGSHWVYGAPEGWALPIEEWRPLYVDVEEWLKYPVCQDRSNPGRSFRGFQHIERTDDGGHTWTRLPFSYAKPVVESVIRRIACQGNSLLAFESYQLRRNDDLGATPWDVVPVPPYGGSTSQYSHFADVAFGANKLFALVDHFDVGYAVHASLDRGVTWTAPLFTFPEGVYILQLIASTDSRLVALARQHRDGLPPLYTPWTSDDGGVTFVARNDQAMSRLDTYGEVRLQVDVLRPQQVMAVGAGVLKLSLDGGSTYRAPTGLPPSQMPFHATWVRPPAAGAVSFVVTTKDQGVLRTDDGGATFLPVNRGLPGARVGTLHAATYQGERFELASSMAGWDEEFYESSSQRRRGGAGNLWVSGAQVGMVARDPLAAGVLVDGYGARSTDAGASWENARSFNNHIIRFTTEDGVADSPIIWASLVPVGFSATPGFARLVRPDGYVELPEGSPTAHFYDVGAAAVAASDPRTIYVSESGFYQSGVQSAVKRSTDGGVTFAARAVPLPGSGLVQLKVDRNDANHLLAVARNGNVVFESFDGAGSWTPLPSIPGATLVYTVTIETGANPRRLYAGTDDGVFLLVGNAPTWERVGASNGMRVSGILVDGPSDRRTVTLSTDSGVWELTQDTTAATLPVYRFYNTQTRTHFYTASEAERQHVLTTWPHFVPEGIAFHAVKSERDDLGVPVWRFFNTQTGTHFYTASAAERAHVLATWPQFVEEGVVYRALAGTEPGTVKLFRFFNIETGAHFTTTEDDERDYVNSRLPMFIDEGATYSVYPAVPQ